MKRNEVIQVRVSPDEKIEYEALAKAQGMNLSEWLRYLASQESMDVEQANGYEKENLGREPEPVKERPAKAVVEQVEEHAPWTQMDEAQLKRIDAATAKRFKQEVARLQAKMAPKEAEAEARKRLGME
jgi:hypothetical protein